MASTYTDLGLELMATGENAGTWGTKTNANLNLIEQLTGGVISQAVTDSATPTALTIANGALTGTAQQRVIELTGTISGNRIVTWPLLTENFYIVKNGTSGSHTVQLKAASGSGATVTFAAGDKGYKLIYLDGVATNTGLFEASIGEANEVTLTGTQTLTNKTLTTPILTTPLANAGIQLKNGATSAGFAEFFEDSDNGTNKVTLIGPAATADVTVTLPASTDTLVGKATTDTLTNKTLTSPAIGTKISDTNGNELLNLTATGSAVNEFTLANAASGAGPTLSSTGETNVDINIVPKGTGDVVLAGDTVKVGDSGAAAVLTSNGAGTLTVTTGGATDLVLNTNGGTNSGNITITDAANSDMNASPNGYGRFIINGQGAIQSLTEKVSIDTGSGPSGTVPFDVLTSALLYNTQGAGGDWTLNIRGNGSTSMNTIMDTGESLTVAHLATITGSEYRMTQLQIDGSNITPEWQGGEAPGEGNVNSVDVYTFTVIKTGNAAFTALAALTQFA